MRAVYLFLSILAPIWAQLNWDESFKLACEQMNGNFKQRESPDSISGDYCSLTFNVAVRDQADADEFCELYAPWRLRKAEIKKVDRPTVTCHVEASLTCKSGWTQMFGYCFMMPDKHNTFTHDEAVGLCQSQEKGSVNGSIAFMHHRYIVGVWRRFFTGIGQIWVDATEPWEKYVQRTNTVDGDKLALAFNGWHFNFKVPPNSLIRIKPEIRMQVICQYKPPMNAAEINYLGRRYSEIYHPAIPVDFGVLVRSASSYTRSKKNVDVCEGTLKPFMQQEKIGPFVPSNDSLLQLGEHRMKNTWLTRAGAEARLPKPADHQKPQCQFVDDLFEVKVLDGDVQNFNIKGITDKISCDHMLSTAITQFPDKADAQIRIMSDSRSLPVWCKLGQPAKFVFKKPEHYYVFERFNGEYVGHRLFKELVDFEEAKRICEADGGYLTGVNSDKEAQFLAGVAKNESAPADSHFWLGGRRADACRDVNGYRETGPCTRNKVIKWQNNVANEFYDAWWKNGKRVLNPDYAGKWQECLSYVYGTPSWADSQSDGFLDDVGCGQKFMFFCTKKLEVTRA